MDVFQVDDILYATDQGTLHPLTSKVAGTAFLDLRSRRIQAVVGCGSYQEFVAASSDTVITVDLMQADAVLESLTLDPFLCDATNCWSLTFSVPAPQTFMVRVTLTGKRKIGYVVLPVVFTQKLVPTVLSTLRKPR
jgi:hypothetical protein